MVLCLLALPVLAILGIFSIRHRKLTLDAIDCLLRTVTLRKCESGLDDRIKADITGTMLRYSPKTAGFFYKNYKIISWIILIIFIWSFYASSVGIYNYVNYGNCNGPDSTGICIFDPTGEKSRISEAELCEIDPTKEVSDFGFDTQSEITYPAIENNDPIIGPKTAELTIIEFGCYVCEYTKKAEPIIQEVIDYYDGKVNFQFKSFHIPQHKLSYEASLAAECALEQNKYIEYHNTVFEEQKTLTKDSFKKISQDLELNTTQFEQCFETEKYKQEVDSDTLAGVHASIPGTPTFFVNNQIIVGPKPFKTFKKIIDEEIR